MGPVRRCGCSDETCDPLDHDEPAPCKSWEVVQNASNAMCTCRECVCNPDYCREPVKCDGQDFVDCKVNYLDYVPITEDKDGNAHECCASFDEVCSCIPEYCPEPPTCNGACQKLVETAQECCTKYDCVCDPGQCPKDEQVELGCAKGYVFMTTDEVLIPAPCECCEPIYKKMCVGCFEEHCPVPVELSCPTHHINVIVKQDCCDCYECQCDPTRKSCPKSEPTPCPEGMHEETYEVECCGTISKCVCHEPNECPECPDCTELVVTENKRCPGVKTCECAPLQFCQWEGKAHFPGATWMPSGDKCTTCYCPSEPNADGLYVPVCNTECCGDCPIGHSRVADSATCCGTCVPLTCVDNEGKQRMVGDAWKAVEDKCVTCTCKQGKRDIYAECFSTRKVLVEDCPEEFIYRSEDGCVVECQRPQAVGGCAVTTDFTGRVSVEHDGMMCESTQDYTINMCSGECVSTTVNVNGKMEKRCSCCSATKTVKREIDVKCDDGSVRKHTIELVEECSCGATKCEANEQAPVIEKPAPKPAPQKQKKKKGKKGIVNKAKNAFRKLFG